MTIADAVRVIAARDNIVDLEFALSLLGYQLLPLAGSENEQAVPEGDPEDMDDLDDFEDRDRGFGRVMVSTPPGDLSEHTDGDYPGSQGLRWFWGLGDPSGDRPPSRVIPYVLESDTVLSSEHTRQNGALSLEHPQTPVESAALTVERITGYVQTWDRERMHRLLLRRVPGRRIDVDRVVRMLAQGQVVRHLPVLPRSKVALPIQVVHDIGLYGGPFGLDLRALLDVVQLAAVPGLELLAFKHSVAQGCGTGPVWRWQPYRVPSRASCVLLVSGGYGPDPLGRALEFHHLMAALNRRGHHARAVWFGDLPGSGARFRPEHWVVRS
ncbi:hypothetical protein [Streptomyces pseudovenezuelae]|uniref:hypothetical protein n=1 Tax=Streptomyces pseudovenezuelae TaxID=67350 RepID=UPI0036E0173A